MNIESFLFEKKKGKKATKSKNSVTWKVWHHSLGSARLSWQAAEARRNLRVQACRENVVHASKHVAFLYGNKIKCESKRERHRCKQLTRTAIITRTLATRRVNNSNRESQFLALNWKVAAGVGPSSGPGRSHIVRVVGWLGQVVSVCRGAARLRRVRWLPGAEGCLAVRHRSRAELWTGCRRKRRLEENPKHRAKLSQHSKIIFHFR